jgi:hypothetical protein
MIETTQQEHGELDILVSNAVARYFGTVENFAPEQANGTTPPGRPSIACSPNSRSHRLIFCNVLEGE